MAFQTISTYEKWSKVGLEIIWGTKIENCPNAQDTFSKCVVYAEDEMKYMAWNTALLHAPVYYSFCERAFRRHNDAEERLCSEKVHPPPPPPPPSAPKHVSLSLITSWASVDREVQTMLQLGMLGLLPRIVPLCFRPARFNQLFFMGEKKKKKRKINK